MRSVLPLILLVACGGAKDPSPGKLQSLGEATPRLPAPEARVYATHVTTPGDPLVATVVGELAWEESLSGAAGALGVSVAGGHPPDAWAVRWAALRAGYPHPVEELAFVQVQEGAVGQQVLAILEREARIGDHVGLVRARSGQGDVWVGVIGRPRLQLEPVPRSIPVGGELALTVVSPDPQLQLSIVSPSGFLERGELVPGLRHVLDEPGEWWVQLDDRHGVAAAFPVTAGALPEATPPLVEVSLPASDADQLELIAWELLDEVRAHYERAPCEGDPILGPVADAHLDDLVGHDGPRSGAFAGEPGSCRASMSCGIAPGSGVEACFQQWLVEPASRAALVDPRCTVAGLSTQSSGDQLWVQLELGQE